MYSELQKRNVRRDRREMRVKKNVRGSAEKPRFAVSKTNKHLFAQLIDDDKMVTIASAGTYERGKKKAANKKSKDAAKQIGKKIAELAKAQNIERVVFDRRRFKFHGIIAELANAAREAGLQF
jgi:large subunit ribosomal protein L18